MHPFPSMVKVPEYPEIALDDVEEVQAFGRELFTERWASMHLKS